MTASGGGTSGGGTSGRAPAGGTSGRAPAGGGPAERWLAERRHLNANRRELTRLAATLYPHVPRAAGTDLLTRPEWLPGRPLPLEEVVLDWAWPPPLVAVTGREATATPAGGYRSYAGALRDLERPALFVNRPVYRLTAADLGGAGRDGAAPAGAMSFTLGRYFDVVDVGEAAAHELTAAVLAGGRPDLDGLQLRARIGDPTDPARRPVPVAISTLTIRYEPATGRAHFFAHWRDPARVATNGGMYQVIPVGMFQPARSHAGQSGVDATRTGRDPDFDLWRCMAREYGEELAGDDEHTDVDYAAWPLFRGLSAAREAGTCRPYCLGIGVDPLTLATDVLTAVVFEAAAYDALFGPARAGNAEGRIVPGDPGEPGLAFTRARLDRLIHGEHVQPAGAAALELAWRYRDRLLAR